MKLPSKIYDFCSRFDPLSAHEKLASCDFYIGEGATMASEAACLGIPSIYVSNRVLGYIEELKNNIELAVDLDMSKITSVLNNAWTEFNFTEASFYQNLIREKIPMIFEQECPFKVKDDKIPLNQPPDPVEALGTGFRTIYDGLSMNEDFFE